MNMLEYLEKDKDSLIRKLENVRSMEEAEKMICTELDHVLLQYNERCELPMKRDAAAYLMQTVKLSSGLINSVGETKVWEDISNRSEKKTVSVKQKLFGCACAVSGGIAILCAVLAGNGDTLGITNLLLSIGCLLVSVFSAYQTGKSLTGGNGNSLQAGKRYHTENVIDADHIYNCLHNVLYAADEGTEQLLLLEDTMAAEEQSAEKMDIPENSIDLFAGLLEAGQIRDGEYALDKIRDIKFYLHKQGIEVVEYDGTNKEMFDFMPSKGKNTFRPALVSDGKVLKRGLASGGME